MISRLEKIFLSFVFAFSLVAVSLIAHGTTSTTVSKDNGENVQQRSASQSDLDKVTQILKQRLNDLKELKNKTTRHRKDDKLVNEMIEKEMQIEAMKKLWRVSRTTSSNTNLSSALPSITPSTTTSSSTTTTAGTTLTTASSSTTVTSDTQGGLELQDAVNSITASDLKAHVSYLASDELEGREAGLTGGYKAGKYIADKFKSYGLIAPNNGSYFQEFNSSWRNVVGYIKGSDSQLSEELIVIGAHYDHIGKGPQGEVYNGADDNASGTAGVLEIAQAFSKLRKDLIKRSILFICFDAEEEGLFGSDYYVNHPIFPLDKTKFMLNMDMIGRSVGNRVEVGVSSDEFKDLANKINNEHSLGLNLSFTSISLDTDVSSFYSKGIPAVSLFTGLHSCYHKTCDDPDTLNYDAHQAIVRLAFLIAVEQVSK